MVCGPGGRVSVKLSVPGLGKVGSMGVAASPTAPVVKRTRPLTGFVMLAYLRGMGAHDQYVQLSSLPEDVRRQVLEFIKTLMNRRGHERTTGKKPELKKPISGLLKGRVRMADDFDAPLDDFKDYM
ncbi:MAG: DUF2281 domain-containing protein [Flavobacteriales bacterium]|nr:DUF2281 domain-containing protein [Flavobacteriales bacterium]